MPDIRTFTTCDDCGEPVIVTEDVVSVNGGWGHEVRTAWVEHESSPGTHPARVGDIHEFDGGV